MHVGEKPYVVTTSEATNEFRGPVAWGQVELSTRVLTTDAVSGMLGQILPLDQRSALDEFGATDYNVTAAAHPQERFTIVAARGGDDIWVEMRRHPKTPAVEATRPAPEPAPAAAAPAPVEQPLEEPLAAAATPPAETSIVAEEATGVEEVAGAETIELIEMIETPLEDVEPEPVPVHAVARTVHDDGVAEPAHAEEVLVDPELDSEIELPFTIEASSDRFEEPALAPGPSAIALSDLDSGDDE